MSPANGAGQTARPIRVIYVGGFGRSGSTILGQLLGQVSGLFFAGELFHIWERAFGRNELCGCGDPFLECETWKAISSRTLARSAADPAEIEQLQQQVERQRFLPLLAAPRLQPSSFRTRRRRFESIVLDLYRAIAEVTGATTIVDSSKTPTHAWLLNGIPGIELQPVLLVRDPRGVAHSWNRKKYLPERKATNGHMAQLGPAEAVMKWIVYNIEFEAVLSRSHGRSTLRYEDFCASPGSALGRIMEGLGYAPMAYDFVRDNVAAIAPGHSVSGNPSRFGAGEVAIQCDDAWRTEMHSGTRRLIRALSFPLMRRYGY